ncbi:DoxX family protein [Sphingomonas soli]|uniref:DoxX family protein n=1 Tax=Sphingomonas soli TaxID=266127 RepID=UPI000833EC78|nr:DoxX family protein [Sphingomonas soli]
MQEIRSNHIGGVLMALLAAFLMLDAGLKLAGAEVAISATAELGFSAPATRLLGGVLALAMLAYLVPVTRVLGAILLTGYFGGAIAIQAQQNSPLFSHILFGSYAGVILWGSIWLRSPVVRSLIPMQRREV